MRTLSAADLIDVVNSAAVLIEGKRTGLCATLGLFPSFGDDEGPKGCSIVILSAGAAPRGELLRVDDHFHDGIASRLKFRDVLIRRVLPFVEGVGKLNVGDEGAHCFVILASEKADIPSRHGPSPNHAPKSASPSA
jgi:hypothetical protein